MIRGAPKPEGDPSEESSGYVVRDRRHQPDAAPPAPAHEDLATEAQRLKDQYLRALAEVDNTKKRLQREQEESRRYAAETLIRGLLPIVDSLAQAVAAVDQQSQSNAVVKGVHLIYRQLLGVLEKEGVKRMATIGQPFDPHHHEAVGHVEAVNGQAENLIVDEVQIGYTMHGKVLRPALVKVAKNARPETGDLRPETQA